MSMTTYLPLYSKGESGKPALISDPSCHLYLPLWKKDGATIISDDRYGHTFTKSGAVWTPQGLLFDNTDDRLTGPTLAAGPSINHAGIFSFVVWFKVPLPPTTTWRQIFYRRYGAPTAGWQYYAEKGAGSNWSIFSRWVDGVAKYSGITLYAHEWVFAAGTYDGAYIRTYRNGVLAQAPVADDRPIPTDTPLLVGYVGGGYIGETACFSKALTQPEIFAYYQATKWRYV
jgi:hypothetical protein